MPEFSIDVEFEVFCGKCGKGICNECSERTSRNRGANQLTVNPCPDCMWEKDDEIADLKKQIEYLESQIE